MSCGVRYSKVHPDLRCQRRGPHKGSQHRAWDGETLVSWRFERNGDGGASFFKIVHGRPLTAEEKKRMVDP